MVKKSIKAGESVPLVAQLHDGQERYQVVASIYDSIGLLLDKIKLTHYAKGLYMSNNYKMPLDRFIIAQYEVVDSNDYEMGVDVFELELVEVTEKEIVGEIISKHKIESEIIGEVVNVEKAS